MAVRKPTKPKIIEVPQVDNIGRLQPQQLDFERSVLGALLVEQESFPKVCDLLKPESFYDHRHQVIFEAIQSLNVDQKPVDFLTVIDYLTRTDSIEQAGGAPYVMELSAGVSSSAHIVYHAQIIAQKSLARQLITFCSAIQTGAFDPTVDVADLLQEAESQLFVISQKNMKNDYTQIDPVINNVFRQLNQAATNKGGLSGLTTGFEKIDKITSGWQKSDLIIIAARPAMGKTAFVISMIRRMAVDNKKPVALFSLEMSNDQLVTRLLVNVCEISGDKMRSGNLAPYEWSQLDSRSRLLQGAPIYVDDTPGLSTFELRTKARRMVREHDVQCIMIDYVQLMTASGLNINSRQEEVSTISRSLKGLAKELNIPIIALSQLNRGVEGREGYEGKRPQLSDLRESGAIEQDADIVCFIHRPEYYKLYEDEKGNDMRGKAEFIIAKHRNGSIGDVKLDFRSEFARFSDPDDSAPMPGQSFLGGDNGGVFSSNPTPEELADLEHLTNEIPSQDITF